MKLSPKRKKDIKATWITLLILAIFVGICLMIHYFPTVILTFSLVAGTGAVLYGLWAFVREVIEDFDKN